MAGGMRIEDHKFFGGSGSPRFPDGPHKTKDEHSSVGVGHLMDYEDTTEKIKSQQDMGSKKVHGHPRKAGHRN